MSSQVNLKLTVAISLHFHAVEDTINDFQIRYLHTGREHDNKSYSTIADKLVKKYGASLLMLHQVKWNQEDTQG